MTEYAMTEDTCLIGDRPQTAYGIVAYDEAQGEETPCIVASAHALTTDRKRMMELVDACNRLELSVLHLHDVVEDFLTD